VLRKIDDLLNGITMYRLITYGLSLLALVTIIYSFTGTIDYDPLHLIGSLVIVMTAGFITNQLLPRVWGIAANAESGLITCLILFFIISPVLSPAKALGLVAAAIIAIASKYLIAWRGKHIFNPAAFGAFAVGALGLSSISWWVGSGSLWVFALVLGLLVARKTRRLSMVTVFAVTAVITAMVVAARGTVGITESLELLLFASPLIFLGTIMMTEPSTMPPRRNQQWVFAALTGFLLASHLKIGPIYIYPEMALLIANVYAFAVSSKRRWALRLVAKHKISDQLYDYEFAPDAPLQSQPGQYMEVTMPVNGRDDRGNRRTFTVASSPTEKTVRIGVRVPSKSSRFKQTLQNMMVGDSLLAGQIAGNFVLPRDESQKLLFMAGGVGITPFRSMAKYLIDTGQKRDVVLIYLAKNQNEFMYKSIFDEASRVGVRVVYIASPAPLEAAALTNHVSNVMDRKVFISGPPIMVRSLKRMVRRLGVSRGLIKTDYFNGY
jgi:ferredoxin-NADP reductase